MFPTYLQIGDKTLLLVVRENAKAKRYTLRFQQEENGRVILTLPYFYSTKQVLKFIETSKPWLEKQVSKTPLKSVYSPGMILPILGKEYELLHKPSNTFRTWWGDDHLLIHAPDEKFAPSVEKSLHQVARQFLTQRSKYYATQLDQSINRITLRNTRSRWGSCSQDGNISYSWRLVFAPENVADYVCAHEVAHLIEMNHSPQYWKIVESVCPDYKELRGWLRKNGKSLFQYGVG